MSANADAISLQSIVEEERDYINNTELLAPLRPSMLWPGEIIVRRVVQVSPAQGTFPPKTQYSRRERSVTMYYDEPTVDELLYYHGAHEEESKEAIQRMYVGAGLAKLLCLERLGRSKQLRQFLAFMSDQDRLMGRLYEDLDIQPGEGILRKLINHADAASEINGLRLSIGIWRESHTGDDTPDIATAVFGESLSWLIANKPAYMEVATTTLEAETDLAEDRYADQMSEVAIAAACPMDREELSRAVRFLAT